jgi:hypothetical protein
MKWRNARDVSKSPLTPAAIEKRTFNATFARQLRAHSCCLVERLFSFKARPRSGHEHIGTAAGAPLPESEGNLMSKVEKPATYWVGDSVVDVDFAAMVKTSRPGD